MADLNFTLRYWELFDILKARLNADAGLTALLGGANRVYKASDDYNAPEGDENTPWGRIVIVPADAGWPAQYESGKRVEVIFIIRTEMYDFKRPGYDVARPIDAAQDLVFHSLDHFLPTQRPDASPIKYFTPGLPMWCADWPQPMPIFDEPRGIWWKTSRWSLELAAVVS